MNGQRSGAERDARAQRRLERRITRVLTLFPLTWRERYGEELVALLRADMADGKGGPRMWGDVVRQAGAERVADVGLAGDARRAVAGGVVWAIMAGLVFVGGVRVVFRYAANWRFLPVDAQERRYGFHQIPGDSRGSVTDYAPWMHPASGATVVLARICAGAAELAAVGLGLTILYILGAGALRVARLDWRGILVPLGAALLAVLLGVASDVVLRLRWGWLNENNRWMHAVLGFNLARWFGIAHVVFALGAGIILVASVALIAARADGDHRFWRAPTLLLLGVVAAMTLSLFAGAGWLVTLAGQAPGALSISQGLLGLPLLPTLAATGAAAGLALFAATTAIKRSVARLGAA